MNTHTSPPVFLEKLVPPRLRRREKAAPVVCRNGDVPEMRVLSVTSEIFPLVKTGGLADVTGSLPKALEPFGVETTSLIPGYPQVMKRLASADPAPKRVATIEDLLGTHAVILEARIDGLNLLVLDAPELFHRPGGPMSIRKAPTIRITGAALPRCPRRQQRSPAGLSPLAPRYHPYP